MNIFLIESVLNGNDDHTTVQHDCIHQSKFNDTEKKNSLGSMVDEWFYCRAELLNKKSFNDNNINGI